MVATNVVYKEPKNTIDFLMHFFVARELFIANALSRHFNWSHNILFVEDLSAVDSNDRNAYSPARVNGGDNNNNSSMAVSQQERQIFSSDSDNGSVDSNELNVPSLPIKHTVSLSI